MKLLHNSEKAESSYNAGLGFVPFFFFRCTKKANCATADKENHWLWSPSGTCVTIISADPLNMSRRAPAKV